MRKIRHSSVATSRPTRKTTGSFGYFKDEDAATKTKGTSVTADFLNDLQDEITTVITDQTGGNAELSDSTNQLLTAIKKIVDDKLSAYVMPVTTTINNFVKTVNNSVKVLTYSNGATVTNGSTYTWPVQTVTLSSIPSGATMVLIRLRVSLNDGGNLPQTTYIRKNNSEAWGDVKITNDPILYNYPTLPNRSESDETIVVPVVFDTGGTFEVKTVYNETALTDGGWSGTDTRTIGLEVWQEGFFVPTTVLTGV